jgi:coenzyme F420-reducing hydrogenase alpha subunit
LQSHYLHVLFLAAPDFLGIPSVIPLIESKPEIVELAARLKGMANRLCDTVAGRTTHPVSLQVGGVARMPDRESLLLLRNELARSFADLETIVSLVETFEIPDFWRETEFVSLKAKDDYPFIGGQLMSTDGVVKEEGEYREVCNEYMEKNNTSKWCKLSRESYAVGSLARFNNNHDKMHAEALKIAARLGLEPVNHNPYMNNVAQVAECVHCTHDSIRLIDELVEAKPGDIMAKVTPRAGRGVGAVEVPRGILFHEYEYDDEGHILQANCVIPTTQNNANIHRDLADLVRQFADRGAGKEKLELLCSMLVRAYDPCISCSVH